MNTSETTGTLAVLASGGLDSAILLAESARVRPAVYPMYMRFGLMWEEAELAHLRRFLAEIESASLRPLVVLDMPVRDLYGSHWSITGDGVPALGTPDKDVYLPGRNVLFLAKALLWCHLNGVPEIALAALAVNPFPDATTEFFAGFSSVVNAAIGAAVAVRLPYQQLHKPEVLHRGAGLPLEWTFSCIHPVGEQHCGACSKCGERMHGFREAGLTDPTAYHTHQEPRSA